MWEGYPGGTPLPHIIKFINLLKELFIQIVVLSTHRQEHTWLQTTHLQ